MKNTSNFESFSILFFFFFAKWVKPFQDNFVVIYLESVLQRKKKKVNREREVNKGDKLKEVGEGERKVC